MLKKKFRLVFKDGFGILDPGSAKNLSGSRGLKGTEYRYRYRYRYRIPDPQQWFLRGFRSKLYVAGHRYTVSFLGLVVSSGALDPGFATLLKIYKKSKICLFDAMFYAVLRIRIQDPVLFDLFDQDPDRSYFRELRNNHPGAANWFCVA
jgi:hypothetical protein